MPRDLSDKDNVILQKLAPECGDSTCSSSGHQFHSILPPVSNHFSRDTADFLARIGRLSDDELHYIFDLIVSGEESLCCLPEEDVEALARHIHEKISPEAARSVIAAYECGGGCGVQDG
jgi:hypothetical protein